MNFIRRNLLILFVCIIICRGADEWLDPNDMINFDHVTMSNRHSKEEIHDKIDVVPEETPNDQITLEESINLDNKTEQMLGKNASEIRQLNNNGGDMLMKKKNDSDLTARKKTNPANQDVMFYKIYMRKVIRMWQGKVVSDNPVKAIARMTPEDLKTLIRFTSDETTDINDAHNVISRMIVDILEEVSPEPGLFDRSGSFFMRYSHLVNWAILVLVVATFSLHIARLEINMSLKQIVFKLIVVAFVISVPMTWYQMYKREVAKQAAKTFQSLPKQCSRDQMRAWEIGWDMVKSIFRVGDDPCLEYHEHMMIDPVFKVSFTDAISVTIVNFFIAPLRNVGKAFGECIMEMLRPLPIHVWPVPILFIVMAMFMTTGYSIRIPFLLSIESRTRAPKAVDNSKKLAELDEKMTSMVELLHKRPTVQPIQIMYPRSQDCGDGPTQTEATSSDAVICQGRATSNSRALDFVKSEKDVEILEREEKINQQRDLLADNTVMNSLVVEDFYSISGDHNDKAIPKSIHSDIETIGQISSHNNEETIDEKRDTGSLYGDNDQPNPESNLFDGHNETLCLSQKMDDINVETIGNHKMNVIVTHETDAIESNENVMK